MLGVSRFEHPGYLEWTLNDVVLVHGCHPPCHSKVRIKDWLAGTASILMRARWQNSPFVFISHSMETLHAVFSL